MADALHAQRMMLEDGRAVCLRPIRPEDERLLRDGFARLSPASRYARFHTALKELPPRLLHDLTHVDGVDHVAIIAVPAGPRPCGEGGEGIGVARFVRIPEEPRCAELAITLADGAQGRGLGAALIRVLAAAARERGIDAFVGYVLTDNHRAQRLLQKLGAERTSSSRGQIVYRLDTARVLAQRAAPTPRLAS